MCLKITRSTRFDFFPYLRLPWSINFYKIFEIVSEKRIGNAVNGCVVPLFFSFFLFLFLFITYRIIYFLPINLNLIILESSKLLLNLELKSFFFFFEKKKVGEIFNYIKKNLLASFLLVKNLKQNLLPFIVQIYIKKKKKEDII